MSRVSLGKLAKLFFWAMSCVQVCCKLFLSASTSLYLMSLLWANSDESLFCRKTVSKQELITAPTESRFQVDVEKNWVESSKITALLQELESFRSSGSKSIVFSQWTAFLDLLQIPLSRYSNIYLALLWQFLRERKKRFQSFFLSFSRNNISFVRLDGTLNQQQREKVLKEFSEDSSIMVGVVITFDEMLQNFKFYRLHFSFTLTVG